MDLKLLLEMHHLAESTRGSLNHAIDTFLNDLAGNVAVRLPRALRSKRVYIPVKGATRSITTGEGRVEDNDIKWSVEFQLRGRKIAAIARYNESDARRAIVKTFTVGYNDDTDRLIMDVVKFIKRRGK